MPVASRSCKTRPTQELWQKMTVGATLTSKSQQRLGTSPYFETCLASRGSHNCSASKTQKNNLYFRLCQLALTKHLKLRLFACCLLMYVQHTFSLGTFANFKAHQKGWTLCRLVTKAAPEPVMEEALQLGCHFTACLACSHRAKTENMKWRETVLQVVTKRNTGLLKHLCLLGAFVSLRPMSQSEAEARSKPPSTPANSFLLVFSFCDANGC